MAAETLPGFLIRIGLLIEVNDRPLPAPGIDVRRAGAMAGFAGLAVCRSVRDRFLPMNGYPVAVIVRLMAALAGIRPDKLSLSVRGRLEYRNPQECRSKE